MVSTTRRHFLTVAAVIAPALLSELGHDARAEDVKPASDANAARAPSSERFDYVVAGAGHNSLICAAYLSKAGYRVLVLEGQPTIGGGCKTTEMLLPGFKEDWCSSTHGVITRNPMLTRNELQLNQYGYELLNPEIVLHYPFIDGVSFSVFHNDLDRTADTIAEVSKKDAQTFKRMAAARAAASPDSPDSDVKTRTQAYLTTLGKMTGFAAAKQVWESPYMQAAAMSGGKFFGPLGSELGTGLQAFSMLNHMAGRPFPKGGSGMLTVALGRLIEAHGGVIMTNMPVTELIIEGGRCSGVACADGSQFRAAVAVVSTMHVKQLLTMAPRELWGEPVAGAVDLMQPELAMFSFHYAFSEPPKYPLAGGGTISSVEASIMRDATSIFTLNEDDARGELHLDDYPLQVCHPSVLDTSRVPEGRGLVKIEGSMPYGLKQGPEHWDDIKEKVADAVVTRFMAHTANLTKDKILAKEIYSPLDIERMNPSMWRGSVHAFDNRVGSFAPYRMPIPGLYQTGACTAPGGSISGLPGRNTAEIILRDQGRDITRVTAPR
jgi:beta-carotene ketolase (CrtO type)